MKEYVCTAVPWLLVPVTPKLVSHFVCIGLKTKVWLLSIWIHRSKVDHALFWQSNEENWFEIFFPIEKTIWSLSCITGNGARDNCNWYHHVIFISAHISRANMSRKMNSCNLSKYNQNCVFLFQCAIPCFLLKWDVLWQDGCLACWTG